MAYTITLIPGDGIGPEVAAAAVRVLSATGLQFEWETQHAGLQALATHGSALPEAVLASIRRNKVALKGPTETPVGSGHRSINVALRKELDLYANVRPVETLHGVKSRYDGVDLIIVRENTEDLYSGLEHVVVPGVVESIKIITEKASTRIARYAFEYARTHGRKRVTAVHKANIMKLSDGLFLDCARGVAKDYPEIRYDEIIVDNWAACSLCSHSDLLRRALPSGELWLAIIVLGPRRAVLLAARYGAGANIGEYGAIFEAWSTAAPPDIAGKNMANPIALVLSAAMMLDHPANTRRPTACAAASTPC